MKNKKVWFVTGASKGLGLTLVKALLSEGYYVAATSRKQDELTRAVGESDNLLPIEMDLTSNADVAKAIQTAIAKFGKIDIVVNNAGYSQIGTLEELTDEEARTNFDVNVFGPLKCNPKRSASSSGTTIRAHFQYCVRRWSCRQLPWFWYLLFDEICNGRIYRGAGRRDETVWRSYNVGLSRIFQNQFFIERVSTDA